MSTKFFPHGNIVITNTNVPESKDCVGMNEAYLTCCGIIRRVPDDFFLLIGQSNALGTGIYCACLDTVCPNAYQLSNEQANSVYCVCCTNNAFIQLDNPMQNHGNCNIINDNSINIGLSFAKEYTCNNPCMTVAVVMVTRSGSSFAGNNWNQCDNLYNDAVTLATKMINFGSTLRGFLWHQGESDSIASSSPCHTCNLISMVCGLRTDIPGCNATIPFIVGTLADAWLAGNSCVFPSANRTEVNNALLCVAMDIDYAATADLSCLAAPDQIHFSAASLRTAGQRYYTAFTSCDAMTVKG